MPAPKKLAPADWLTLIADRAPQLREAGVLELTVDGVTVRLAPYEPPPAQPRREEAAVEDPDPLNDPATFGRIGRAPGFDRPRRQED